METISVENIDKLDFNHYRPTVSCRGADSLPLDAIEEFQGELKKRTAREINQIILSIYKYGFSFPFFIWQSEGHNLCLDGHGRILALSLMRERGADLPLFPVVYVEAVDEDEAKQKLLRLNSQYGKMTLESFVDFIADSPLEVEDLSFSDITLGQIEIALKPEELPAINRSQENLFKVKIAEKEPIEQPRNKNAMALAESSNTITIRFANKSEEKDFRDRFNFASGFMIQYSKMMEAYHG